MSTSPRTRREAARIREHNRASIIDTGRDLIAVKGMLKHGQFGAWLPAEFGMARRIAQNYVIAVECLDGKGETVSHLPARAAHLLASRSAASSGCHTTTRQYGLSATAVVTSVVPGPMRPLTFEEAHRCYDLLVVGAGANPDERPAFVDYVSKPGAFEWRIGGNIGFGGIFRCGECLPNFPPLISDRGATCAGAHSIASTLNRQLSIMFESEAVDAA